MSFPYHSTHNLKSKATKINLESLKHGDLMNVINSILGLERLPSSSLICLQGNLDTILEYDPKAVLYKR